MATEIIVPSSLGQEFNFALPASLPSSKTYEIRVQPVNAQSFNTAGSVIQFDIPCNKRGQYLDPTTTYVRFKATYTQSGSAGVDTHVLLGSAYSYFSRQEVYGNNSVTLETINEYGVLANLLLNTQLNSADKVGMSASFGLPETTTTCVSNVGHIINGAAPNQLTFEYAIPVIGILGSGTDKMLPIGAFYSLRLELTMDSFSNFVIDSTANKTTLCTISEVEFVGNVIELSSDSQSLIETQNPSKIHIRSQSFRTSTNNLAGSSGTGLYDLLIGTRVSSLKSLYITCAPSNAIEGKFAGVNPNLTQGTCLVLGGQSYPQRTISPSYHPADSFLCLQKSIGALNMVNYNGSISKTGYYTSSTATGLMSAYNTTLANAISNPNQFYLGFDVETISHKGGLLSGLNVNGSPSFFRAQVDAALSAYTHTFYFFAFHDVILEIDVLAKTIVSKF